MKKIIILMVCLWGLGNTFTSAQTTEKEKFISSLMKQMTLDEDWKITGGLELELKSSSSCSFSWWLNMWIFF